MNSLSPEMQRLMRQALIKMKAMPPVFEPNYSCDLIKELTHIRVARMVMRIKHPELLSYEN